MTDCPDCGSAPTGIADLYQCGTVSNQAGTIRTATCQLRECLAKLAGVEKELARFRDQQGKLRQELTDAKAITAAAIELVLTDMAVSASIGGREGSIAKGSPADKAIDVHAEAEKAFWSLASKAAKAAGEPKQ